MKKVFTFFAVALLAIVLVACGDKEYNVTFDLNYDGAPEAQVVKVKDGNLVGEPEDPERDNFEFLGWFLEDDKWNFADKKVSKKITLKAKWRDATGEYRITFETRTDVKLKPVFVEPGNTLEAPAALTRTGYNFGGWYLTKAGRVWDEVDAQEFPLTPEKSMKLYAYWEPLNSKTMNYSAGETYVSTMVKPDRIIMNPLEYRWSHEDDFIDMLVAPLYSTEVDWAEAMKIGLADYPGDFSKIQADEYSVDALDYHYVLIGAQEYPVNEDGESAVIDGKFDRDLANELTGKVWTYKLRDDLVFEDGTPIDAKTFEYTLKNWLDPAQNAYRANMWWKTEENKNGRPVLNTLEYNEGDVEWEDVGFKVGEADENGKFLTFTIETWEDITLQAAVGMGNDIRLLNPVKYEASIDKSSGLSQYGTPDHLFSSYGPFIVKSWDENARIVFNKNYTYVARENINYKSQVIEIVADTAEAYNLFKAGETSVLGLTKEYYAEYAEDPNVKDSWVNFPQYMIINQSGSKLTGEQRHVHPSIMSDKRFRQALLFGFNRKEFAYNVYAPNHPASSPITHNGKNYTHDAIYYTESEQHMEVISELGFEIDDYLFGPAKAKALFDSAYTDWLAEGNTGPITLRYVTDDSEFAISLDEYIKESYETLFADESGNKRLIIDVNILDGTGLEHHIENHNFDLTLTALGFGHSLNAYWQYAAIALFPGRIGASGFGLYYPFIGDPDAEGKYAIAEYVETVIEVDFSNSYAYLMSKDEEDLTESGALFLSMLDNDGFFRGTVDEIATYILGTPTIFTKQPAEPFEGASYDLNNLLAAWERVFYDYAPVIPTVTRASSTIYADNVHIEWPKYSDEFGWGAARYRYLTTDPDFADRAERFNK